MAIKRCNADGAAIVAKAWNAACFNEYDGRGSGNREADGGSGAGFMSHFAMPRYDCGTRGVDVWAADAATSERHRGFRVLIHYKNSCGQFPDENERSVLNITIILFWRWHGGCRVCQCFQMYLCGGGCGRGQRGEGWGCPQRPLPQPKETRKSGTEGKGVLDKFGRVDMALSRAHQEMRRKNSHDISAHHTVGC
jgi:hypothetical protein